MHKLDTLIPKDFVFRTILLALMFLGLTLFWFHGDNRPDDREFYKGISYALLFIVPVSLFDLYLRRGYRISWDEAEVRWRKVGLRRGRSAEIVLQFDELSLVSSRAGSIMPFEAVVLEAGSRHEQIILSRLYLRDNDIRELLICVSEASQAQIELEVVEYMLGHE